VIISKTPFRVSFFGGGTDYHTWYQEHGGQVLSTTIDHYCYLNCRLLPPFFTHNSRVVWSKIEEVIENGEIAHPVINAVLKLLNIDLGVEVHHQGDLPARSGIGSSSTFTVGFLNSMYNVFGYSPSKKQLADEAIYIERQHLKESVGIQDQIAAAYGGFNHIKINTDGSYNVIPVDLSEERKEELNSNLLLFFTGVSRFSSEIASKKIDSIPNKYQELSTMSQMVDEGMKILNSNTDLEQFGKLLHESWILKRSLSESVSTIFIDEIYETAMKHGATGGKILGAGGGGFILFYVKPEFQANVMKALKNLLYIPFGFDKDGAQVIFNHHHKYKRSELIRQMNLNVNLNNINDLLLETARG